MSAAAAFSTADSHFSGTEISCPQCTYLNHHENTECTMCGAMMDVSGSTGRTTATAASSTTTSTASHPPPTSRDLAASLFNFGSSDDLESGGTGREFGGSERRGGGKRGRGGDKGDRGDRGDRDRGGRGGGRGRGGRRDDQPRDTSTDSRHHSSSKPAVAGDPLVRFDVTHGTRGTWKMQQQQPQLQQPTQRAAASTSVVDTVGDSAATTAASSTTSSAASSSAFSAASSAAASSSTVAAVSSDAQSTQSSSSSSSSSLPVLDPDDPEEFDEAAERARLERGMYERAPDGTIVHRNVPLVKAMLAAASSTSSSSAATFSDPSQLASTTPCPITSIGFPEHRWRTSLRTGSGPLNILLVAEKPSIALTLASVLATRENGFDGGQYKTRSGLATPVHEFTAHFNSSPAHYRITSVCGHIYSTDFEDGFTDWSSCDIMKLFGDGVEVRKICEKGSVIQQLRQEAKGIDLLILCLDADREGENIAFEVMENCVGEMNDPRGAFTKPHDVRKTAKKQSNIHISSTSLIPGSVLRAKFSSLTSGEILRSLQVNNLIVPDLNESRAVDARQEIDLRVGVAFTRFQTRYFQAKYGSALSRHSRSSVISYGPCQIPTLAFVVKRADQVEKFVKEEYWSVDVKVRGVVVVDAAVVSASASSSSSSAASLSSSSQPLIHLTWSRGSSFFSQSIASLLHNLLLSSSSQTLLIRSITSSESRRSRPLPLNTVELLKISSRQLGIGPVDAMRIAERLYLRGYISYPRTETTQYSEEFDVRDVVRSFVSHQEFGEYAKMLLDSGKLRHGNTSKRGINAGDHPPITPTQSCSRHELGSSQEWKLYEYIARHFLATVSEDAISLNTVTKLVIDDIPENIVEGIVEEFNYRTSTLTQPGFLEIMPWLTRDGGDENITLGDQYKAGDRISISSVTVTSHFTSPPGFLTESELIGLMEQYGIGTDASISTHIKSISDRGYITSGAGRTLRPTQLGSILIHGYQRIDPDLIIPKIRGEIEKELTSIAKGESDYLEVVKYTLEVFARKFAYFVQHIEKMDQLFQVHFGEGSGEGEQHYHKHGRGAHKSASSTTSIQTHFSLCGKCHHYMTFHPSPAPPRLHCGKCDEVYILPVSPSIKKYRAATCPLDGFELLIVTSGTSENSGSYTLCPYCYTYPPFASSSSNSLTTTSASSHMSCSHCPSLTCRYSLPSTSITRCPEHEQCGGYLVLDPAGGPHWKLRCNQCNCVVTFAEKAYKVQLATSRCARCQSRELEINFHKDNNPLIGGTVLTACLFCHDLFRSTSELIYSDNSTSSSSSSQRGGRGGRGGGDRGRGGGRGRGDSRGGGGRGRGGGRGGPRDGGGRGRGRPRDIEDSA